MIRWIKIFIIWNLAFWLGYLITDFLFFNKAKEHKIKQGIIICKVHKSEYSTTNMKVYSLGKVFIAYPSTTEWPEEFIFNVQGKSKDGIVISEEWNVSKKKFDKYNVGDSIKGK